MRIKRHGRKGRVALLDEEPSFLLSERMGAAKDLKFPRLPMPNLHASKMESQLQA